MFRVWDTDFRSLRAVSRDPRCKTSYAILQVLLRWNVPLERAVEEAGNPVSHEVTCWGETFPSLAAVCRDPRCGVPYVTMISRLKKKNWPLDQAVGAPKTVACWGETFKNVKTLSRDPRCQVPYKVLLAKLGTGMSAEQATSKLPLGLEEKSE